MEGNIMTIELKSRTDACPYSWKTGYPVGIRIGCCGDEVPTFIGKKWYIYLWDSRTHLHIYYCFNDDLFLSEAEFQTRKENN